MIEYTVKKKDFAQDSGGDTYSFTLGCNNPNYQSAILAVSSADWAAHKVGDKINVTVSAAPVAVSIAPVAEASNAA